jgi:hypothetical protein
MRLRRPAPLRKGEESNDLTRVDDAMIDDQRVRYEPDGRSMSSADGRDNNRDRDSAEDPTRPGLPPQSYSPEAYPPESYPTQAYSPPPPTLSFPTGAESPWARPDPAKSYPAPPGPGPYPVPPYPQYSQQPQYPPYAAYPPYRQEPYPMSQPYRRRNSATGPAAFAFGFLALVMSWVPFVGIGFGIAGVLFAGKAMQLSRMGVAADRGLAIAGLALSIIGIGANGILLMMLRT